MKKIFLFSMIAMSGLAYQSADAQIRVSLNINIGSQPDWGPAGYDDAQYYYLPEADMYYNVGTQEYVYNEGGSWINMRVLPPRLRNFDLYNSYKVVINERNPWLQNDRFRRQYSNYRNNHDQMSRRDSHYNGQGVMARNDRTPDFRGQDHGNIPFHADNNRGYGDHNFQPDRGNSGRNMQPGHGNDNRGGREQSNHGGGRH